ncbi:MAG: UMP kinase [Cellulomonadaceae bacterium]|jgi:uridylate kinase|nr:UMP kinase [Cellulomonadaceae bacterium]
MHDDAAAARRNSTPGSGASARGHASFPPGSDDDVLHASAPGDGSKPRRVLLKLSGEAFGGGQMGVDAYVVRRIAEEIAVAVKQGVQVAVVVGGGNYFRGADLAQAGMQRERADYMGMLGTVMNCLSLQDFLEKDGVATRVQTAIAMGQVAEPYIPLRAIRHLEKGRVVIFGAGAGLPYFSTDTVAIQRALEIGCDEVLMGKNGVDGVYDADPNKVSGATKFDHLTFDEALERKLAVMDSTAMAMARDNGVHMRVFGLEGYGNVTKSLLGEKIGTEVTPN